MDEFSGTPPHAFSFLGGMQHIGEGSRFTHLVQSKVRFSAGPLAAPGSWSFIAKYRLGILAPATLLL